MTLSDIIQSWKFWKWEIWNILFKHPKPHIPIPPPCPPKLADDILDLCEEIDSDLSPRLRRLRHDWIKKENEIKELRKKIKEEVQKDPDLAKEIIHAVKTLNNILNREKESAGMLCSQIDNIVSVEYYYAENGSEDNVFEIVS